MSDELFLKHARWGYDGQLAIGAYLNSKGIKVTVPPLRLRPSVEEAAAYTDDGDVLDENGNTFEVQRMRKCWSGRSTFPWTRMLVAPVEKLEQLGEHRIRGFFTVSGDLRVAVGVSMKVAREHWYEAAMPSQSSPGTMRQALMCPLEYVKFVALPPLPAQGSHPCHCGKPGTRTKNLGSLPDGELVWVCQDHERW